MNNNLDFLNKTEVNSFVYSSINDDRFDCKEVTIDGRQYTKWGKLQIVTFVGMMYAAENKDTGITKYFITIGMSKQHPQDIVHDKKTAMEVARINAITNPVIVMYDVSPNFDNYSFKAMMKIYYNTMDLDFVMTTEECKKKEKEEFAREWDFYLNKTKNNE